MKDAAGLIGETGETDTSGIEPKTQESGERTRNRSAQTVPFCGFATDRQLTFETDHIGGYLRTRRGPVPVTERDPISATACRLPIICGFAILGTHVVSGSDQPVRDGVSSAG